MKKRLLKIMRLGYLPIIILFASAINTYAQGFSVGLATSATRYNTGDRGFDRPVLSGLLSPGNELMLGYNIKGKLSVSSGVNYQVIAIHSRQYINGFNLAIPRNNVYIKQISFPVMLILNVFENKKNLNQQIVAGAYWGKIISDHYISERYYPTKGRWYESGVYTFYEHSKNFYNLYAGYRLNYLLNEKFSLNFEPFVAYQLKNDVIIENVYDRFMYGFKLGIMYHFKSRVE